MALSKLAKLGLVGLAGIGLMKHREDEPQEKPAVSKKEINPEVRAELRELWRKWNRLINMGSFELKMFLQSPEGKGSKETEKVLQMTESGRSFEKALRNWKPKDWERAQSQTQFIKRMKGLSGPLFKQTGEKSKRHVSLLKHGHNPTR